MVYCDRNRWSNDENLLFFKLADAFQPIHHVNFICILPYLGFKDTSFAIFASTSHVFDNVRMLLIEILHPQLALSITCGYTSLKFCIFNPPKSIISDISPYYSLSDIHIYYHYIFDTVFINIVGTNCQKMARVVILWYTSIMSRFSYLL